MNRITTKDGTSIFYKDWGSGPTVVLSHGWPLSADAWDAQMLFLGQQGCRVVAHDRRGHGRSGQTWTGNEYAIDDTIENLRTATENLDELTESVKQRPWSLVRVKQPEDRKVPK